MDHDFEDIEVKENALELLKKELIKRPKTMIGTGSMTDPYIPAEKHLQYEKIFLRFGFCIVLNAFIYKLWQGEYCKRY